MCAGLAENSFILSIGCELGRPALRKVNTWKEEADERARDASADDGAADRAAVAEAHETAAAARAAAAETQLAAAERRAAEAATRATEAEQAASLVQRELAGLAVEKQGLAAALAAAAAAEHTLASGGEAKISSLAASHAAATSAHEEAVAALQDEHTLVLASAIAEHSAAIGSLQSEMKATGDMQGGRITKLLESEAGQASLHAAAVAELERRLAAAEARALASASKAAGAAEALEWAQAEAADVGPIEVNDEDPTAGWAADLVPLAGGRRQAASTGSGVLTLSEELDAIASLRSSLASNVSVVSSTNVSVVSLASSATVSGPLTPTSPLLVEAELGVRLNQWQEHQAGHVVYVVELGLMRGDTAIGVTRKRYSEFEALRKKLEARVLMKALEHMPFPAKKMGGRSKKAEGSTVAARAKALGAWLNAAFRVSKGQKETRQMLAFWCEVGRAPP